MMGLIKTNFECMRGVMFSQNAFLRGMYQFDEGALRNTFLGVLRFCTISMTAAGKTHVPLNFERLALPFTLAVA